jgi:hypothetical protein
MCSNWQVIAKLNQLAREAEGIPVLILRCAFRGQDIYVPVCIYLAASRGHSVI